MILTNSNHFMIRLLVRNNIRQGSFRTKPVINLVRSSKEILFSKRKAMTMIFTSFNYAVVWPGRWSVCSRKGKSYHKVESPECTSHFCALNWSSFFQCFVCFVFVVAVVVFVRGCYLLFYSFFVLRMKWYSILHFINVHSQKLQISNLWSDFRLKNKQDWKKANVAHQKNLNSFSVLHTFLASWRHRSHKRSSIQTSTSKNALYKKSEELNNRSNQSRSTKFKSKVVAIKWQHFPNEHQHRRGGGRCCQRWLYQNFGLWFMIDGRTFCFFIGVSHLILRIFSRIVRLPFFLTDLMVLYGLDWFCWQKKMSVPLLEGRSGRVWLIMVSTWERTSKG